MSETPSSTVAQWKDTQHKDFQVLLHPERIRLEGPGTVVELPRDRWRRDLYIAHYGSGYLVRVETFEQSLQFVLTETEAAPLLSLIAPPAEEPQSPAEIAESAAPPGLPPELAPRTWPKVSRLAIWALICSSAAFIPILGWVPALAAVILLFLHRLYVPRTPTMAHSRAVCFVAFGLLITGLFVSVLAVYSFRAHSIELKNTSLFAASPDSKTSTGIIIVGLLVVLISLSVHEAAHAITAWWLGDGLAKSLGRVTLNPLAHIDPVGTVLLPIMLAMFGSPIFGYARPVPVFVENLPRHRRAHILISIAGPGSNMLLAAISLMLLLGLACTVRLAYPDANISYLATGSFKVAVAASGFPLSDSFAFACTFLKLSFVINLSLAMFNLIPIPPLDGSWVLEHLFPRTLGPFYAMIRPYGFLIFVLLMYSNVFDKLALPVFYLLAGGLSLLAAATGW